MKKYISKFHYLTQDLPDSSHIEQTRIACEAGANWVQYRCLTKSDEELMEEIHQVAAICDDWGATLILTNHYHLLDRVDAQGVHIEALLRVQNSGVIDYCGYGPFAHTNTKPNNKPLLGFGGYRELQKYPIDIPVIAVGGIQLNDAEPLLETGIHGIAVSGAINLSPDPGRMLKEFYQKVY